MSRHETVTLVGGPADGESRTIHRGTSIIVYDDIPFMDMVTIEVPPPTMSFRRHYYRRTNRDGYFQHDPATH